MKTVESTPKGVSVSSGPAVQGSLTRWSGPSILKDRKPGSETGVKFGADFFLPKH